MAADYYSADTENGDHMDDPSEDGHDQGIQDNPDDIARELTIWLAARDHPGRPTRRQA
jgi:hypothetical protein